VKISLIAEVMKISRHMCSMQVGLTSIMGDSLSFVQSDQKQSRDPRQAHVAVSITNRLKRSEKRL